MEQETIELKKLEKEPFWSDLIQLFESNQEQNDEEIHTIDELLKFI